QLAQRVAHGVGRGGGGEEADAFAGGVGGEGKLGGGPVGCGHGHDGREGHRAIEVYLAQAVVEQRGRRGGIEAGVLVAEGGGAVSRRAPEARE
nr:hypothetical protein [Tanacetum cinerariifolium]